MTTHIPVLRNEAIEALLINDHDVVVDATLGGAGYAKDIVGKLSSDGVFVGIDADAKAIARAQLALKGAKPTTYLVNTNFRHIGVVLDELHIATVNKVVFDLGLSSYQLEEGERGFTFQKDEPLIMTFATVTLPHERTARDIVNEDSVEALTTMLFTYGDEKYARRIATAIVSERAIAPIETTGALVAIIEKAVPVVYKKQRTHPATRTFQALRIAVNEEYDALTETLTTAISRLSSKGRIAVVSFHSGEDRIVKTIFREAAQNGSGVRVTKKPIVPRPEEIEHNPRSRSAKLRVFEAL